MSRSIYKNNYAKTKYDRITLQVPKGTKEEWKALAADSGLSLNEYICRLVAGNQVEIFDRMQIADKYRRMIRTLTGSTKEGYTVTLKDGFVYEDGTSQFWSKSKPKLRKNIKKCHAHDTL